MNTENENSMSPDHPHGKPDPRWITDDGRCLLCADSYHKRKIRELEILLAEKNKTCNIFMGQVKKLQASQTAANPPSRAASGSVLPCPFCGGEAKIFTRTADGTPTHPRQLYWYVCNTYGCEVGVTHGEWNEQRALEKWNQRAPLL